MTPLVIPGIAQLRPYVPGTPIEQVAQRLGLPEAQIVKLASNENPLGPSPAAIAAARQQLEVAHLYPDSEGAALRSALAQRLNVDPKEIVLGSGSNEILELLVRTFCAAGEHVVFSDPSFPVYRMACLVQGAPHSIVPLKNYDHDLAALANAVTPRTRIVFIDNPNNPTGTYVPRAALTEFLSAISPEVIVVLDEAYCEYAEAPDFPDGLQLRGLHPRLVVARTFSKIYGLAGLRVGYGVMPTELAGYVNRVRSPFNVSNVAQAAALAALEDDAHLERSRSLNSKEKRFMAAQLQALGLEVVPSEANFLLVDVARPGPSVYEALVGHGVIIRPIPPLPTMIRVTIGTHAENERCLAALAKVVSQTPPPAR
jgi:histidinol-phosphate aminotransferase